MSQHLAADALLLTTLDKVFAIGMTGLATCAAIESSVGCLKLAKAGQKAANLPPWWNQAPSGLVVVQSPPVYELRSHQGWWQHTRTSSLQSHGSKCMILQA
jgi:hypothetical protein